MTLALGCSGEGQSEEASVSQDCPPVTDAGSSDASADVLPALLREQQPFVQAHLPDYVLRQVFVLWATRETSFLYTDQEGNGLYVSRDRAGQWQAGKETSTGLDREVMPLEPLDLRHGPESVVRTFEANVPGIQVGGVGLVREECDLRWHVGGFLQDASGKLDAIVEGVILDETGEFELKSQEDVPTPR